MTLLGVPVVTEQKFQNGIRPALPKWIAGVFIAIDFC